MEQHNREDNIFVNRILKVNEGVEIVFNYRFLDPPDILKTRIRSVDSFEKWGWIEYGLTKSYGGMYDPKLVLRIKKNATGVEEYHWSMAEWILNRGYQEYSVVSLVADAVEDSIAIPVTRENIKEGVDAKHLVAEFERQLLRAAMDLTGGHQLRAARLLGMNSATFYSKLKKMQKLYATGTAQEES